MMKTKYVHCDWGSGVKFQSVRFSLCENNEVVFKRYVRWVLRIILREYRCYSFILIENKNTSKIEKRKNEIRLKQIIGSNHVVYLDMDEGVFACFEIGLFNFDNVYGKQIYFAFSKNADFMLSMSESLNSYSYDGFIETLLLLNCFGKSQSSLPKDGGNPIFTKIREGDIFIETSFSELFSNEKFLGFCYNGDFSCPIIENMVSESLGEEEHKPRFELLR